jgi:hypothetical protein
LLIIIFDYFVEKRVSYLSFPPKSRKYGPIPGGKYSDRLRPEYCFLVPAIFGVSLLDTVNSQHLFCRIQWPESSTWV